MKLTIFIVVCGFIVDYSTCLNKNQLAVRKLEISELEDLLNASLASDVGHQKANIVYKWKYGDYPVKIDYVTMGRNGIFIQNDVINVDPGMAENFLKVFGKSIKRLSIAYSMIKPMDWLRAIGKYVNEYCAETLVELSARDNGEGVFDNMTKPFAKVQRVAFDGSWKTVSSNQLGLNELFPELRVLNLSYCTDEYILERVFPKLVELNAKIDPSPALLKFLENNKRLKKLRLKETSMELLHVVNENLPELDVFDFHIPSDLPSYNGSVVEFKHVKAISIKDDDHNIRTDKIVFWELKKLQLVNSGKLNEASVNFIGSNEQLETLIIPFGNLNNPTLSTLASKLHHLVEVDVRCDLDISIGSIVNFIERNPKLRKAVLNFSKNMVFLVNDLSERLKNDWIVAPVKVFFSGIELRRKDATKNVKIENLELPELLSVSLSSDVGHQKANILYKWKYGDFTVEITYVSNESNQIFIGKNRIHVDPGLAENFLKAFGKSIKRLSIAYHMIQPISCHKAIGKYVNEYCAETLIEFSAKDSKEGIFDNMTKPFTKVQSVAYEGIWKTVGSNQLGLNELFPELHVLNLSYYFDGYILGRVFPKLVELNVDIDPSPALLKFLENNKHLKKLRLKKTSMDLLHVVNENLPELDVFDFDIPSDFPSYNGSVFELKHVKEVSIKNSNYYIRTGKIVFKQLKKLELSICGKLDDMAANLIGSNEQLETLIIPFGHLNDSTLSTLASKLHRLVEVDVRCELDISIGSIVKFMESNPQLKKIVLNFFGNTISLLTDLNEKLGNNWVVQPVNEYFTGIIIRRKETVNSETENANSAIKNLEIENLELQELLNVSLTSDVDHQKANMLYYWKYGNFRVEISYVLKIRNGIFIQNDVIYVDFGVAESFLKGFGKSIKRLSVTYHLIQHMDLHKLVGKYVNEYCAETLIEFGAKASREGVFQDMTKPFTKVERVALDGAWEKVDNNQLGLDELFPELRVLDLSSYSKGHILERVFPKLVELNTNIDPSPALLKFLENNKHLKKLRLKKTSMELLHVVNENLPELDVFDFDIPSDLPSYNGSVFELKHVKEISIKNSNYYIRTGKIVFKQLKKLELSICGKLDDMAATLIGSNEQLETLIIPFGHLSDSTLSTLAPKLLCLVEVDVRCELDISIGSIVKFIENNPQLKKIVLNFFGNTVFLMNDLSEKLGNDWIVQPANKYFTGINIRRQENVTSVTENVTSATENADSATENITSATENSSSENGASHIFSSTVLTFTMVTMTVRGITLLAIKGC